MTMIIFLAFRSLLLQRKRYFLMALAIFFGFTLITVIHSLAYGALETVKLKAARYFSGHISITGYADGRQILADPEGVIDSLRSADLPVRTIASRTIYYRTNASLFFAGESIRQRRLIGIDFLAEEEELSNLEFLEGSIDNLADQGRNGILISEAAAHMLGARVGDSVMLYITTDTGQYNTATLYVRGIFRETSLFGYVAYMRQEDLNRLLLREPGSATDIALYAEPGVNHGRLLEAIREHLSSDYRILPHMPTKAALTEELARVDWENGPVLAPLTLDAHLDQITNIIDAFLAVAWFILVLFVLIVMVGILNTYRVLVYERTREIGTMRAMGMTREKVRWMFLLEAAMLAVFSILAGFIFSLFIMRLFTFVSLGILPGAGLFTDRGLLKPHIDAGMVALTFVMMLGAVVAAAYGPANRASRVPPAEALRTEQ